MAERTIGLQQNTADLTQRLLDGGARQRAWTPPAPSGRWPDTRASLPPLRAQRDGALFRLATLTGVTPAEAVAGRPRLRRVRRN